MLGLIAFVVLVFLLIELPIVRAIRVELCVHRPGFRSD
jgi:hypothetical protein